MFDRGAWRQVRERLDPTLYKPLLAPDIEIKDFTLRWGNDYAMAANPRDLVFYRLLPWEAELMRRMDGTRTVNELVAERLGAEEGLDPDAVADLITQLRIGGFLEPPFEDVDAAVRRGLKPVSRRRARAKEFFRTLSIEWSDADRLVRWLYRNGLKYLFTRPAKIVCGLIAVAGLVAFGGLIQPGAYHLEPTSAGVEFVIIWILNLFIIFAHELGHALVVIRHGRRVKSAGFRIYYGAPAFFVDSSDAMMLDRRTRIGQAWAGPYAEMILAAPAALYVWLNPDGWGAPTLYKWAVLNYFILWMNLVPLLELDGYWILSDAIQVPDLRPRSLAFLRYDLWHKLRTRVRINRVEVGLLVYGVVGIAFTIFSFWLSYFFWKRLFFSVIESMWESGLGGKIMLVALGVFIGGPIVRGIVKLLRSLALRVRDLWRAVAFRAQKRWRVEAAGLLDRLAVFEELPVETLNEIAGRVRLQRIASGQPVVRQGEPARAYYVVRRGSLDVVEEGNDGRERVIRTLGRGEAFGELGLVERATRTATVRATVPSEVFELDAGTFQRLLEPIAQRPRLVTSAAQLEELRRLPPFRHLETDELARVLYLGEWVNVAPGSTLIEQGAEAAEFYAIGSGRVEVLEDGRRVRELGPGSHVGEVALLRDSPRTASVRTLTPVRAFRLSRAGFDRLVRGAFRRGLVSPHAAVGWEQEH
ncbi:MAG: cyclic nucleotide-binding domain-containing protein [Actinomycetota bacterium]